MADKKEVDDKEQIEEEKAEPKKEKVEPEVKEEKVGPKAPEEKVEEPEEAKIEEKVQASTNKGSNVALIVIIILLAVIILGVGAYFGFKYYLTKNLEKLFSPTATQTSTQVSLTATATTTATAVKTSGDYIIPDTNAREISESELTTLTPWQLKVARNEIYARHGREFVHKDLQCYFAKKTWYGVDPLYSESAISVVENKNIATILGYEEKINSPILEKDTGCNTNQ